MTDRMTDKMSMSMKTMPTKDLPSTIRRVDGKVVCTEHGTQEVASYCKRCAVLACNTCVQTRHMGHDVVSVKSQAMEDKKALLKNIPGIRQTFIPSLRENLKFIKESRETMKSDFVKLHEQINSRSIELIKEIHNVRDRMIKECKANQETTTKFLNETESKIVYGISTLERTLKSCEEAMKHDNAERNADIIFNKFELDQNIDSFPSQSPKLTYPLFLPGTADDILVTEMFGGFKGQFKRDIEYRTLAAVTKKMKPNITSSFRYKTDVRAMCLVDSNSAWLSPISQYHELVKVDKTGKELDRRDTGFQVYDLTITQNQDILATNSEKKSLMQILPDGGFKEVTDLPLRPRGLYSCKNGELLLCLCDAVDFPNNKDGKRQVVRMDKKYRIRLTIESYDGHRSFTLPDRVTENTNGDICVIDRTGGGNSHLCVFTAQGKFLFTYPDEPLEQEQIIPNNILKKHSFRDVCCDSLGNIIISDEKCNEIVVLTKHGAKKCLLTHRLQRVGGMNITSHFYRPSSLGIDGDGKLWVLQKQGITIVDLYSQWMPAINKPALAAVTPRF